MNCRMSPHIRRMTKGRRRMSPRTELRRLWRRMANLGQEWAAPQCGLGYLASMGCHHPGSSRRKRNPRRIRRSRHTMWETRRKSCAGRGKSRPHNPRRSLATLLFRAGRQCGRRLPQRHHRLPAGRIGRDRGPCLATSAQLFDIEVNQVGCER